MIPGMGVIQGDHMDRKAICFRGGSPKVTHHLSLMPHTLVCWGEYWRAGHLFFTIPHPCLFLPPLTKQTLSPPREVPQVDRTRPQTFHAKHKAEI